MEVAADVTATGNNSAASIARGSPLSAPIDGKAHVNPVLDMIAASDTVDLSWMTAEGGPQWWNVPAANVSRRLLVSTWQNGT